MESGTQVPLAESSSDPSTVNCTVLTQKQTTQQLHLPRLIVAATPPSSTTTIIAQVSTGPRKSSTGQHSQNEPPLVAGQAKVSTSIATTSKPQGAVTVTAQIPFNEQNAGIHTRSMTASGNSRRTNGGRSESQNMQSPNSQQESVISSRSVSDSEARQEAHTIYPSMQLVPSGEFSSDMFYTTSAAGGSAHHAAHHLQSGATYSVYGDAGGGAYSPQIYYQNSNLAYQQSLHSPGSTYAIHGQHPGGVINVHEDDGAAQQLSHTTRASPATIQWLLQNYETAEGVSLPRCTLYGHYLKHCGEHKLDPVNAASFGKLIRSVFLGLRTRRLGTRGNSKYHYYGIRIKPDSPLNKISDDNMTMAMRQQPSNPTRRLRGIMTTPSGHSPAGVPASTSQRPPQQGVSSSTDVNVAEVVPIEEHHKHFLGVGLVPNIMPPSGAILEASLQRVGLSLQQADKFFAGYRQHCEDILEYVKNLMFNNVDCCWRQFWQAEENSPLDDGDDQSNRSYSSDINLTGLTRNQLYTLCTLQPVLEYIQTMDFHFYQVIANVLIPNVLKPMPSALTQSVRNFAKKLENCLAVALQGAPEVVVKIKLDAVCSLAQTVRRYTSLNHLAQAARAVLQNPAQISQMLTDLNRVDFRNVHEQASWVCYCSSGQVEEIEKSFKATLEGQKSLEEWACWLENVVDQILTSVCNRPYHELIHFAQQFLLKWSFYNSMVMRDLTLRSAPSFGSFHLIRLLFDEYMFYLIEQRVARASGQTTVAIMSQSYRHHVEIEELDSYHATTFSNHHLPPNHGHHHEPPPGHGHHHEPPPSHGHHHEPPTHHHGQVAFVADQFQIVNADNVPSGENIVINESVTGSSRHGLEQTPGSADVEDYSHDPSSQFFAMTSGNEDQNECLSTTVGEIEPQIQQSPGAFSHCSAENLSDRISAVNQAEESSSIGSIIDQNVLDNSTQIVVRSHSTDDDDDDEGDEDGPKCKMARIS